MSRALASAHSSENYALNWSVVGSGGGETTSGSYAMQSTIEAGYWHRTLCGESEVRGDVNGDGEITAADAVITLEIVAGSRPFDSVADVDGDCAVTSLDALMILQAAVGAIEIF